jgi:hypothetical protein
MNLHGAVTYELRKRSLKDATKEMDLLSTQFYARDCRFSSFDIGIITNQTPVNRGEKKIKKTD